MNKTEISSRTYLLNQFVSSPDDTFFNQLVIAAVRDCSIATMERDRWAGTGVPFYKIGRSVKYKKSDVLDWLNKYQPQQSTAAA